MELISIIIPVYNVEKYIRRCIDSVISQTYVGLEIILVDDGSMDLSGVICEEYAQKDNRIKVIHKPNGGLSSARNAGLKVATGNYIAFVDSDDFIHSVMYEIMLEVLLKTNSDMVVSGIKYVNEENIQKFTVPLRDKVDLNYECVEHGNILKQLTDRDVVTVVQWNKLFKKDVLDGVEYPEGRYHEDVYVIHKELYHCKKVTYLKAELYYYVQRNGSIMHIESQKMMQDAVDGYCERISFMKALGLRADYERAVQTLFVYLHWKFCTTALSEGYSDTCDWIGRQIQLYVKEYPEYKKDSVDYRRLVNSPKKYYNYLIIKQKRAERIRKILEFFYKIRNKKIGR